MRAPNSLSFATSARCCRFPSTSSNCSCFFLLSYKLSFLRFAAMQGAHQLRSSLQSGAPRSTSQLCGAGRGGNSSVRMRTSGALIRAGAATVQGEDDQEPKYRYGSSSTTATSSFGHIVRPEVGLKKMDNVLLPHALGHWEFLQLASRICDEVETKLELHKSKKPHRLSTTSWDLLD